MAGRPCYKVMPMLGIQHISPEMREKWAEMTARDMRAWSMREETTLAWLASAPPVHVRHHIAPDKGGGFRYRWWPIPDTHKLASAQGRTARAHAIMVVDKGEGTTPYGVRVREAGSFRLPFGEGADTYDTVNAVHPDSPKAGAGSAWGVIDPAGAAK